MRGRDVPYLIAAVAVVVVACVVAFFFGGREAKRLAADVGLQRQQMTSLQNQIATRQTELKRQQTVATVDVQALDEDRVERDDVLFREVATGMTTWDGRDAYDALLESVADAYHVSEGDRFLDAFLPRWASKAAQAGAADFTSESTMSSSFVGMRSRVSAVAGDMYSYFTVVTADVVVDGETTRMNYVACYTVDKLGNFSSLSGYILT